MAKGETKKTNELVAQDRSTSAGLYQPFLGAQQSQAAESYAHTNDLYGNLYNRYSDLASGANAPGGVGGYQTIAPQFTQTDYTPVRGTYEDFQKTGGVDINALRGAEPTFQKLMNNADLSPEMMARMRGAGVYDEFAKTGGYTPGDIQNIRSRATSSIPGFYGSLQNELGRQRRIGGGGAAASGATALKLAREQSRQTAETGLSAELGIADRIRQGRQFGAQGASGSEQALQGLRLNTMLGAGQAYSGTERAAQQMQQAGRMWGTQGVQGIQEAYSALQNKQAEANAAARNASAASGSSAANQNAQMAFQARMAGIGGLENLRQSELGAQGMYGGQFLQGAGGLTGTNLQSTEQRYNAPGNNKSPWETIAKIGLGAAGAFFNPAGALIGAGAAAAGGGGGLGFG